MAIRPRNHIFLSLVLPLALLLIFSCKSVNKNSVHINGTIKNCGQSWIKLFKVNPRENVLVDSCRIDDKDKFEISFGTSERAFFILSLQNKQSIMLCADKGENIVLSGESDGVETNYNVTGSLESEVLREYSIISSLYEQKIDSIGQFLESSQSEPNFPEIRRSLDSVYLNITTQLRSDLLKFVNLHDTSFAAMLILNSPVAGKKVFDPVIDAELFGKISKSLNRHYSGNAFYKQFSSGIQGAENQTGVSQSVSKSFQIGEKLPDISLPDASKNLRPLSSTKGKLILLYFWTSWNQECREKNIQLASLKEEYSDKGFNIYSVSLDTDLNSWQVAIRADKAYWPQVIDTSGLTSKIAREFNVEKLPSMILMDDNRKLIAQNVKIDDLKRILMRTL